MMNKIWLFLIIAGSLFLIITGNIATLNNEILLSVNNGLELLLSIGPLLILWSGLMRLAEKSGILDLFSSLISPLLSKLFPSVPKKHESLGYIASNIAANMIGLGSAATPFGLKAMESLQTLNEKKDTATDAMITFLVLNTAGVTLIPTTVLALRTAYKSSNPTIIIIPAIIATTISSICGLTLDYLIRRRNK